MSNKKTIFFSACEASADIHCANLIKSIKQINDDFEFVGIGGANMEKAGCHLIENPVSRSAMLHKAFAEIGYFYGILKKIKKYFKTNKPDLVVVCDSPAFNFHVAKAAKKNSVKTFFYVAPQLWAWAPWRIRKLKKCCDKLACILPFEPKWFGDRGLQAEFVGNPLLAGKYDLIERAEKSYQDYDPQSCKIALIPGSRRHEIESIWPAMCQISLKLKEKYKNTVFTAVAFNDETREKLQNSKPADLQCDFTIASVRQTAEKSDFTFVTSGSACLEVASAGSPMCIMYQANKYLWHMIGKWLVRTKNLSLVNILAGRELVPEFMPYFDSIDPIFKAADNCISDPERMKTLSTQLVELTKPLAQFNAETQAAALICKMV